jgi:Protein kinase domain
MQSGQAMPPQRAVQIISKVLSGLDHAHSLGILHRDIKPANILVSDQSSVKITDFGIARALGSERLTRDLRVVGTPEYLAPERVKGEEGDLRSDLYSVGVVLYELLAGRLPFEHNSDFELMRAHLERAPLPLRTSAPSLPPALESIVNRALAKQLGDRFANAKEMRDALEAVDLKSAAQETRFLEPVAAATVPATRFVAVATVSQDAQNGSALCIPKPSFFAKPLVWVGIAGASLFALLLIFIFARGVNRPAPQPAVTQEVRKEAPAPVVVEKPDPAPQAPAVVADPPPAATNTQTDEDAAAQQRRAERARRRAAALRAWDQ